MRCAAVGDNATGVVTIRVQVKLVKVPTNPNVPIVAKEIFVGVDENPFRIENTL